MRKIQILSAFAAVLAFSAVTVANASATLWLKAGASLTKPESAPSHGTIVLHHTGGFGSVNLTCTGLFVGTVGPGATDEITLVENLTGTEKDLIKCKSSNSLLCSEPTVVHAINLPWHTLLLSSGGKTVDMFSSATGSPGYEALCNLGQNIKCENNEEPEFLSNGTNGAIFEFLASQTAGCSDGGTGDITGSGEILGFTVS